ncbi:MAG TPA: hypothetical protein VGF76_01200 [Polyangiaceae bacterium]
MLDHALNRRPFAASRAWRPALSACLAVLLVIGCSGSSTVYEVITVNGGAPPASGGADAASASGGSPVSRAGSAASLGGVGAGGAAGDAAQAGDANPSGVAGYDGGTSTVGGGAGGGDAGDAGAGSLACGTLIADVPPDCHATIACDAGSRVVDQNNVPTPTNACILGTCNSAGVPSTALAPAGTPCSAAGGGSLCDGVGKCVPCLHVSDCKAGQICSASHQCVSGSCTDVDCGGACPACESGKKCLGDADCSSFACDAVSLTCITPQCQDHHQDGVETDADCGGGFCPACVLSKGCLGDADCLTLACDALKLICVGNQCLDHRLDGYETDIDCGGGTCPACGVGASCHSNFDCPGGHFCNTSHVCQ